MLPYRFVSKLQHKHTGIVLAAGASSRMGRPKALLPTPAGTPLALHQADLLFAAGASDVILVLGAQADTLAAELDRGYVRLLFHPGWENGRLSSLQAGLRAAGEAHGALVLPVDTVGVRAATLSALLHEVDNSPALAIRPHYRGKPGRLLWLSHQLFEIIGGLASSPDFRLDAWMTPHETAWETDDPAVLNNTNTPAEWAASWLNSR